MTHNQNTNREKHDKDATLVVILAAGKGTRLEGQPEDVNKCATPLRGTSSPLLHTVRAFLANGISRFRVTVGHAAESVRNALEPVRDTAEIQFVENPLFATTGCNYSLACAVRHALPDDVTRVIVVEGDSLLAPESIGQVVDADAETAVLVRPASYINPARSVVALGKGGNVVRFAYDYKHVNVFTADPVREGEEILGESMQVWAFGGEALGVLKRLFLPFIDAPESSLKPFLDKHLLAGAAAAGSPMRPVLAVRAGDWINMNTRPDVQKAENCEWVIA